MKDQAERKYLHISEPESYRAQTETAQCSVCQKGPIRSPPKKPFTLSEAGHYKPLRVNVSVDKPIIMGQH